jgi:hypothetical protein
MGKGVRTAQAPPTNILSAPSQNARYLALDSDCFDGKELKIVFLQAGQQCFSVQILRMSL